MNVSQNENKSEYNMDSNRTIINPEQIDKSYSCSKNNLYSEVIRRDISDASMNILFQTFFKIKQKVVQS